MNIFLTYMKKLALLFLVLGHSMFLYASNNEEETFKAIQRSVEVFGSNFEMSLDEQLSEIDKLLSGVSKKQLSEMKMDGLTIFGSADVLVAVQRDFSRNSPISFRHENYKRLYEVYKLLISKGVDPRLEIHTVTLIDLIYYFNDLTYLDDLINEFGPLEELLSAYNRERVDSFSYDYLTRAIANQKDIQKVRFLLEYNYPLKPELSDTIVTSVFASIGSSSSHIHEGIYRDPKSLSIGSAIELLKLLENNGLNYEDVSKGLIESYTDVGLIEPTLTQYLLSKGIDCSALPNYISTKREGMWALGSRKAKVEYKSYLDRLTAIAKTYNCGLL